MSVSHEVQDLIREWKENPVELDTAEGELLILEIERLSEQLNGANAYIRSLKWAIARLLQ